MTQHDPETFDVYEAEARLSEPLDGQKALDTLARLRKIGREVGFDLTAEEIREFIDAGRR